MFIVLGPPTTTSDSWKKIPPEETIRSEPLRKSSRWRRAGMSTLYCLAVIYFTKTVRCGCCKERMQAFAGRTQTLTIEPSRQCLYKTMTLLRQYCFGDRPCAIDFLSDQSENFPSRWVSQPLTARFSTVNYQDPNFNVAIPVFSIHGNHDEPSGVGGETNLGSPEACVPWICCRSRDW